MESPALQKRSKIRCIHTQETIKQGLCVSRQVCVRVYGRVLTCKYRPGRGICHACREGSVLFYYHLSIFW